MSRDPVSCAHTSWRGFSFSINSIFLFDLIPKIMPNRFMAGNKNSGKKKGATSFIAIPLCKVAEVVMPNAEIIVSRKWAEAWASLTLAQHVSFR